MTQFREATVGVFRSRNWSLSVQRWRATAAPPLSSNLGAAPVGVLARRSGFYRLALRALARERFWISVTARHGVVVTARLEDGRAVQDEQLVDGVTGCVVHRFARIVGEADDGIGSRHVPVFHESDAPGDSVVLEVGSRTRIHLRAVRARDFDASFGAQTVAEGGPYEYGGWHLP